ncbi:photosystem II manganese-stabilizing polypeptide [Chamaesiphon polymorphus]|uniref:Photosystem II extrinsic protein O n=1 Tax=Chamaesiphon polymorphus CCALA 037 TaxID=2107692 RepID=A0A2T1GKS5_9CYAN|nr:photosystem II manganese-stabilizing polypeptide [Chamaesiphon polymorphus]PSB58424.1 Photosystem II manganese-stabilizing polypeptide [Chamaesiphon polymorphus CCALA 037]
MKFRGLVAALLAICIGLLTACSDAPVSATTVLTYEDIRGTGLANNCPVIDDTSRGSIPLDASKTYQFVDMCIQPTNYFVKEEPQNKRQEAEFVAGKLVTRATSSLDQIRGTVSLSDDRTLTFKEEDGIDFQAITVKMPGGELVPFLFTVKELEAKSQPGVDSINTSTDFAGEYKVPSYRGAVFLDPKGRGVASGYDNANALQAEAKSREGDRKNTKRAQTGTGKINFEVAKVNSATGEVAGIFESEQPSDTDLGALDPKEVKIRGLFYARLEAKS